MAVSERMLAIHAKLSLAINIDRKTALETNVKSRICLEEHSISNDGGR